MYDQDCACHWEYEPGGDGRYAHFIRCEQHQREADDERALAENDDQRDYAEERFNARLMREV